MEAALHAAKIIKGAGRNVQFILVGGGIEADHPRVRAAEVAAKCLLLMPRTPQREIGNLLAAAE